MLKRLQEFASAQGLEFGVKLTNTLPVDILAGELPGAEMYMSGKALYPLSMSLAAKLASDFNGDIRISYSGGADFFNIGKIVAAGNLAGDDGDHFAQARRGISDSNRSLEFSPVNPLRPSMASMLQRSGKLSTGSNLTIIM